MLKRVVITNYLGESMEYKIEGVQPDDRSGLLITSIDGLGPVKGTINMADLPTTDGSVFNSARLSKRNIVIKGLFTNVTSIEDARLLSYKYFPVKKKVEILVETDNRTVTTNGYVESNEPVIFAQGCGCQISILCENPYFNGDELTSTFGKNEVPKSITYTGDSETGVEMKFELPSADIVDSFSVYSINITKDGNKTMGLDLSKMANLVPNTAPTEIPKSECSFAFNGEKYKFLQRLPEIVENGIMVFYKNELHAFFSYYNTSNQIYGHIKLNEETKEWVKLPDTNGIHSITWLVNLNDTLFAYSTWSSRIYTLNDETNEWEEVWHNPPIDTGRSDGHIAAVIGNYIHCFDSSGDSPNIVTRHYTFDGNSWTRISDASSPFTDSRNGVYISRIISDGKSICILGGTNTYPTDMYIYRNDEWTIFKKTLPIHVSNIYGVCIYENKLHIIGIVAEAQNNHYSCSNFLTNPSWNSEYDFPYGTMSVGVCNEYMYGIGGSNDSTYTEEANNIKIVENDQLIVNTVKGKKSITILRGTNKYNVLNILGKDPSWFELNRGVNQFSFSAVGDEDKLTETIKANRLYEGV